jgi:hypothetical protein
MGTPDPHVWLEEWIDKKGFKISDNKIIKKQIAIVISDFTLYLLGHLTLVNNTTMFGTSGFYWR